MCKGSYFVKKKVEFFFDVLFIIKLNFGNYFWYVKYSDENVCCVYVNDKEIYWFMYLLIFKNYGKNKGVFD